MTYIIDLIHDWKKSIFFMKESGRTHFQNKKEGSLRGRNIVRPQ